MRISREHVYSVHRVVASERKRSLVMKTSTTGRQPGQARNFRLMNNALTPEILAALSAVSLQCVECSAHYPGLEVGSAFRYRCDCGGTLRVAIKFILPLEDTEPARYP